MSFSFEDLMQYDMILPPTPTPMPLFEIQPATPKPYASLMTPNVDRFEACIINEDNKSLISTQTNPSWWMPRKVVNKKPETHPVLPKAKISTAPIKENVEKKPAKKSSISKKLPNAKTPQVEKKVVKKKSDSLMTVLPKAKTSQVVKEKSDSLMTVLPKAKTPQVGKKVSMVREKSASLLTVLPKAKTIVKNKNVEKKVSMGKPSKMSKAETIAVPLKKKVSTKSKKKLSMEELFTSVKLSPLLSPTPPPEKENCTQKEDLFSSISSDVSKKNFQNPKVVFSSTFQNEETLTPQRKALVNFRKLNVEMKELENVKRNLFEKTESMEIDFGSQMVDLIKTLEKQKPEKSSKLLKEKINILYKKVRHQPHKDVFSLHPSAMDYLEMCRYASRDEMEDYYEMASKMSHFG